MKLQKETQIAIDAVKNAMKVTEWFRKEGFKVFTKKDESPVTFADIASQILIVSRIKENFPDDMIIGEEDESFIDKVTEKIINRCFHELGLNSSLNIKELMSHEGEDLHRQWTIDPIDGTLGYSKGLVYAVGICFMNDNDPRTSTIGVPHYNNHDKAIFIAEKGKGANRSTNGFTFQHIKVNQKDDIKKFILTHSLHYDEPWVVKFANQLGITELVQIDSMAKICMVADGIADVYIKPINSEHTFSWDFAPGYLLAKEAGGRVTDLEGKDVHFKNELMTCNTPGLIASNGVLHDLIVIELEKANLWK